MKNDTPSTKRHLVTATFRTYQKQKQSPSSPLTNSSQSMTKKKGQHTKETKDDRLLDAFATREADRFPLGSTLEKIPFTPLVASHELNADPTLAIAPQFTSDLSPGAEAFILKRTPRTSPSLQFKERIKQLLDWSATSDQGRPSSQRTPEEKKQRKRQQNAEAQRKFSGRKYRKKLQATYQKERRALEAKQQATPEQLRKIMERIIRRETPKHKGAVVKEQELQEFRKWVEQDIASLNISKK